VVAVVAAHGLVRITKVLVAVAVWVEAAKMVRLLTQAMKKLVMVE
jgi:hypothetical protein